MSSQSQPEEIVVYDVENAEEPLCHVNDYTMLTIQPESLRLLQLVKKPRRGTVERLKKTAEEGPIPLLIEVKALKRQRFWCSRESCWTNLLDEACSL